MEILDSIPFEITVDKLTAWLRLDPKQSLEDGKLNALLDQAQALAKPKGCYRVGRVLDRSRDAVKIEEIKFTSRVLGKNLEKAEQVFPYAVTCGRELESIEIPSNDLFLNYCFDVIKEMILWSAHKYLKNHLREKFGLERLSHMNPGSLQDWPLEEQKSLFTLLGDVDAAIGVKLLPSNLLQPVKSVSGIFFPLDFDFQSCMLCPNDPCSHRRAQYNPEMVEQYQV